MLSDEGNEKMRRGGQLKGSKKEMIAGWKTPREFTAALQVLENPQMQV